METNQHNESNKADALTLGRRNTTKIVILLTLTFVSVVVSVFLGSNNNVFSALSSVLLILSYAKLAEYNPSDLDNDLYHKYFWGLYLLAGVTFVFAIKCYMSSFILFDGDFGEALMWIGYGVYFVCLKPSKTALGYKILKAIGYILISSSVMTSYISSAEYMSDMVLCISMFVVGIVALYFGNRAYLKEIFKY